MKNAECYRIAKVLLPHLPGFATNKKHMIFMAPIGGIWRGFLFESSGYTREVFYFWWFFMPIGRPIEYLTLGYGSRLDVPGIREGWRTDMPGIHDKLLAAMELNALPVLRSLKEIPDTIEAIHVLRGKTGVSDINVQDDLACLLILDGKYEEADAMLDNIIRQELGNDRQQWILNVVERMKGLRFKLLRDPKLAVDQVKSWQDHTFAALKLENWR